MPDIPYQAWSQCGVFSREQAFAAGWTQDALRWAIRRGRIVRLRVGAYQTLDVDHSIDHFELRRWEHAAPAVAAALTTPGAQASHSTAAVLRGLPLLFLPRTPCVSVVPWHTGEIASTHVHRTTATALSLPVAGVSCTSVARTAIDLGREHGVPAAVVALDYALRHRLTDGDELATTLAHCRRWPGVRAAREAVAAADPRSESVLESVSRLKLAEFGMPGPQLQVDVADQAGRHVGRVDFLWPDLGVVGEADGAGKYDGSNPAALIEEKQRQERLEDCGLLVVRWGWPDLRSFDVVIDRLRRTFAKARKRTAADRHWTLLPPRL